MRIRTVMPLAIEDGLSKNDSPNLETECRLFPPVTIFMDLFPRAGYFFNASD